MVTSELKRILIHKILRVLRRTPPIHASPEITISQKIEDLLANPPEDWTLDQRIFLVRALSKLDLLCERALHAFLGRLRADRQLDLLEELINDDALGHVDVRKFHRNAIAMHFGDESLSLDDVAGLYSRASPFLRPRIQNQLLALAVRQGASDRTERILADLDATELVRLRKNTIFGAVRVLTEHGKKRAAADVLARYLQTHPSLQPYFLEPLLQLNCAGVLVPSLRSFCETFRLHPSASMLRYLRDNYSAIDEVDRRNFNNFILKPLAELPEGARNFMDIRFVPEKRNTLLAILKARLTDKEPLSLLRLGDGEAYAYDKAAMDGTDADQCQGDNEIFALHWWGELPSPECCEDIRSRVRKAVADCDILGIPSVFRIVRDLPGQNQRYGSSRPQRGLAAILNAFGNEIPLDNKILTEERCHQILFGEANLAELANIASSVVIVSCWGPDRLSLPFQVQAYIRVPPAQKLKRLKEAAATSLSQVYPEILTEVRQHAAPGTLMLVGAGIIGKFLVAEAREGGAVAIDVGSMLDYLAGSKTRSIADVI
jgi:glycosyltransferase GT-like protein